MTAQFAPVAPIQVLEGLKEQDELGDYHLLLTHHILEYKERFAELFPPLTTRALLGKQARKSLIVDNSLVELKSATTEAAVLEACECLGEGHIIVPVLSDVMGDGAATRRLSKESYEWWNQRSANYPLMVVLQAGFPGTVNHSPHHYEAVWTDFCKTADEFLLNLYPQIKWVGIPRVLTGPNFLGSRERAIKYVQAIRPDIKIHLLGFSDNVPDDILCARMGVEGIDSAVPLRCPTDFVPSMALPSRPANWFESAEVTETMLDNLYAVRHWIEG